MSFFRLQCEEDGTKFYFESIEDANTFLYVFKDHHCYLTWKGPELVAESELSDDDLENLYQFPKERAIKNLSWGFNLMNKIEGENKNG